MNTTNANELAKLAIEKYGVPEHCALPLARYLTGEQVFVGRFLYAVLTNNLTETYGSADSINQSKLRNYIRFLYNEAPSSAWGSPDDVHAWQQSCITIVDKSNETVNECPDSNV